MGRFLAVPAERIQHYQTTIMTPHPLSHFLCCIQFLRMSACVCRTKENCKSLVLQGKCNIIIFLSPGSDEMANSVLADQTALSDND